jgi:nucleoredoxin
VKVEELKGKLVALYFASQRCGGCSYFTTVLSEIYRKLSDFEIVFISADRDEKSFEEYHRTMPWLALPFSDENTREKLDEAFHVYDIPYLVLLNKEGGVITTEGVELIDEYGVEPFTAERFDELRAKRRP